MGRTLRDAVIAVIVERSVNALFPRFLPYAWLVILAWLTWDLLRAKPLKKFANGAYSEWKAAGHPVWISYIIVFVIGGGLLCLYWVGITGAFAFVKSRQHPQQDHAGTSSASPTVDYGKQIAEFGKRLDSISSALTQNPSSIPDNARLSILTDEHNRLAERQNELTSEEGESFKRQGLTIKALEEGRKRYLESLDIQKRLEQIDRQQKEIERQKAMKAAQEANAVQVKTFIVPYVQMIDYATGTLVKMLSNIAKESSETVSSDFQPADSYSFRYAILKDGNVAAGEQIIRLGSSKEWEFHVSVAGSLGGMPHKDLSFQISVGKASVFINNEREIMTGNTGRLLISYRTTEKELFTEKCSLTEYQKPIDQAISQLIRDHYYEHHLEGHPTQP